MRILFIAPGYLPYTFSENLCNGKLVYALQEKGWEVDVISRIDEGPTYCSEWQEPWLPLKKHTYEISYQKALELHKKNPYDVIITRSPSDIPHIIGYKIKQKTGIRWIANWNDPATTIWPEPYTHHLSPREHNIAHRYTVTCLKKADVNTFPSQTLLEHFEANFSFLKDKQTAVIPHIGLPESFLSVRPSEKRDKMYMCHSGNLSSERNPELTKDIGRYNWTLWDI